MHSADAGKVLLPDLDRIPLKEFEAAGNMVNRIEGMNIPADLEQARREGVTRPENLPFLLRPDGPCRGRTVLVHGFSASPWEMKGLAERLASAGYLSLGVRLPGHGTRPEDLLHRRYEEWLAEVVRAFHCLADPAVPVFGAGMSTGALLLLAAAKECSWAGLALLSPYLSLQHPLAPFAGLIRFFKRYQETLLSPESAPFFYRRRPVNGICQLNRLTRRVRRCAGRVTAPALVISGKGDQTVRIDSARELYRLLGSSRKEYHLFGPEVPHTLTTPDNPRRREIYSLVLDFFRSLDTGTGHPPARS